MKASILLLTFIISANLFAQKSESKLNSEFVVVDERVELLYTIEYLAQSPFVSHHQTLVKWEIDDSLSRFSNHEAVLLFKEMEQQYGFTYYRPLNWLLQYSDFPNFEKQREAINCGELIKNENVEYLEKFRKSLIDFYNVTNFHSFYSNHYDFYNKLLNNVIKSKTLNEIPHFLEIFYGTKLNSYNVILSPLLHQGGYNLEYKNSNCIEVFAIIGPNGELEFSPIFDKDFLEKDLMIHEFSHSFVNPLVEKYKDFIMGLETKYFNDSLQKSAKNEGYSDWIDVFDEMLVRSNTILITKENYGAEDANYLLNYELNSGFYLIPQILEIMEEYENNRQVYKKYDDFLPILIIKLKE